MSFLKKIIEDMKILKWFEYHFTSDYFCLLEFKRMRVEYCLLDFLISSWTEEYCSVSLLDSFRCIAHVLDWHYLCESSIEVLGLPV